MLLAITCRLQIARGRTGVGEGERETRTRTDRDKARRRTRGTEPHSWKIDLSRVNANREEDVVFFLASRISKVKRTRFVGVPLQAGMQSLLLQVYRSLLRILRSPAERIGGGPRSIQILNSKISKEVVDLRRLKVSIDAMVDLIMGRRLGLGGRVWHISRGVRGVRQTLTCVRATPWPALEKCTAQRHLTG